MDTPTLGYQEEVRFSKSEVAQLQLVESINLFLAEKFLCSTTLAGAAELVFVGLLSARDKKSVVEESVNKIRELQKKTGLSIMEDKPDKYIYNHWNKTRNAIKHHRKNESEIIVVNIFDEAYWMIQRSLENAKKLNVEIKNENDFNNWCMVNLHF